MLAEITYPFPNFDGTTVEVWEWISNFIPCLLGNWLPIHARIKVNPCKKGGSDLVNSLCYATTSQWSYYPAICEVYRKHYCRGIFSVLEQSRNSKPISRGCDILRDWWWKSYHTGSSVPGVRLTNISSWKHSMSDIMLQLSRYIRCPWVIHCPQRADVVQYSIRLPLGCLLLT